MARIPTYRRQVRPEVAGAPRVLDASVDTTGLARGVQNLSSAIEQVHQRETQEAEQTFAIDIDSKAAQQANAFTFNPETGVMAQKGANAFGITQNRLKDWDTYSQGVIDSAATPRQKQIATRILANQRSQLESRWSSHEFEQQQVYKNGVAAGAIATAQNDAALKFNDPAAAEQNRLKITSILDLQGELNGWSPELLESNKQKAISGMYSDILRRHKANDPFKAQARLKDYQQFLTADDLTQVGSSIDAEVERRRQRAEMQQRLAEAKAERALAQIDAQNASGLPATDEMWAKWGAAVSGTTLQAEFNERRQGEVEIQKVMSLPDAQQQAFVNQRMAELQEKGGTVQQLNAVNRLQRTIAGGQKLRAEAPIVFAQSRDGLSTDVYNPSADNASDVMADRLDAIKSMREQFGPTVAMKPLLPQEAAGIAAALEGSTPDQQGQILDSLYRTIRDKHAYMGALQQIRPDSPVTAVAGAIYGKQKEIITETNFFDPNEIASSSDVAKTILRGESLINRTKQSKAGDGKGSFQMPSDEVLDAAIDSYVGEAYSNRPQAKFLDRQVIRAAYAGKSAEYNGGSKEVAPDVLDWSVKAAVGEIDQFNGKDTIVPWGMSSNDFRKEARRKLLKAISDNKLGPPDMVNRLTLEPIGGGQFLVYRGNQKQPATPGGRDDLIITIGDRP